MEVFQIVGQTFIAFSEQVSNGNCGSNGLGAGTSSTIECNDVEIFSRIYYFVPSLPNPRGDCPPASANANLTGCQTFRGEFVLLQSIPTMAATSMHYFQVVTSDATHHFLAVAEQYGNDLASANSSIWLWNGQQFGLFQQIETNFATHFRSFTINTETFLAVTNRGCPSVDFEDDATDFARCDAAFEIGRTRIWSFDTAQNVFVLVPESSTMGTLHAYGANFQDASSSTPIDSLLIGQSAVPVAVEAFQLASFTDIFGFGALTNFIVIANFRNEITNLFDSLHPRNFFTINVAVSNVCLF